MIIYQIKQERMCSTMNKDFINKSQLKKTTKYNIPAIIIMNGYPGSGKTYLTRNLSHELGVFVLSNDYVRTYCYVKFGYSSESKKNKRLVASINKIRLANLLLHKISFVLDADINSLECLEQLILISKVFGYSLINIKIESNNDFNNIERIQNRIMDFQKYDDLVIGDNVNYSTAYSSTEYFDIKQRKPRVIDDCYFDFIITNDDTLSEFDAEIKGVVKKLGERLS